MKQQASKLSKLWEDEKPTIVVSAILITVLAAVLWPSELDKMVDRYEELRLEGAPPSQLCRVAKLINERYEAEGKSSADFSREEIRQCNPDFFGMQ